MAKIVVISGSPNSGKTAIASMLSLMKSKEKSKNVIVLLVDNEIPKIKYIFPYEKLMDESTLKTLIISPKVDEDKAASVLLQNKKINNLAYCGFINRYDIDSKRELDEIKMSKILKSFDNICDYLYVVLSNKRIDDIVMNALGDFKKVNMFVTSTNLKSWNYHESINVIEKYSPNIVVINNTDELSPYDLKLSNIDIKIPYSYRLKENMNEAAFFELPKDRTFIKSIEKLSKIVEDRFNDK